MTHWDELYYFSMRQSDLDDSMENGKKGSDNDVHWLLFPLQCHSFESSLTCPLIS